MNDNNTILAIETSSDICGISFIENGTFIDSVDEEKSKQHAEALPQLYKKLQSKTNFSLSNSDALAVSIGPGSFTGLRIGLSFTRKFLPTLGIIHSHAKRVFYQKIRWMNMVPYPDGDIKVAEWSKILDEIDQTENIFQLNCGKLDKGSDFISTSLSSSSIGILANINFNELVTDQPYDLVPYYVSPFIVHKK